MEICKRDTSFAPFAKTMVPESVTDVPSDVSFLGDFTKKYIFSEKRIAETKGVVHNLFQRGIMIFPKHSQV